MDRQQRETLLLVYDEPHRESAPDGDRPVADRRRHAATERPELADRLKGMREVLDAPATEAAGGA